MPGLFRLLRDNHNYRCTWLGQIVSETGDGFNNVAVLSLAVESTGSGLVAGIVMLSRAIPAVLAGPLAGVILDRFDRRKIMIASDLVRAVIAAGFLIGLPHPPVWLLYALSALLMFASPFFTAGRAAILPSITTKEELHTANSVTQTTQWVTLTVGTLLAGWIIAWKGYGAAFLFNSLSFVFSAGAILLLKEAPGAFRAVRESAVSTSVVRPWREYREGLAYMRATPLIFGIAMISVGWATGGGAAQVLFALFGEQVFHKGASGIGTIWGFAGIGLIVGGMIGHWLGKRLGFAGYKRAVVVSYVIHGAAYVLFSQMRAYWLALLFIAVSRVGMAVTSVLNFTYLLRHTRDEYRGRVFSTMETLRWGVMMFSMAGAGVASEYWDARFIGAVAGVLSSMTAAYWGWADWSGRLPEPAPVQEGETTIEVAQDRPA